MVWVIMGPINPYYWVDEMTIPYYMEMSWEWSFDPIAHVDLILDLENEPIFDGSFG